jgi:CHAT domain-containing protein
MKIMSVRILLRFPLLFFLLLSALHGISQAQRAEQGRSDLYAGNSFTESSSRLPLQVAQHLSDLALSEQNRGHDLQSLKLCMNGLDLLKHNVPADIPALELRFRLQQQAMNITDKLLEEYGNPASQLLLTRFLIPLYHDAISVCYSLYELKNKDTLILHNAFEICEKSRLVILRKMIRIKMLDGNYKIPAIVLEQQRRLAARVFVLRCRLDKEYLSATPRQKEIAVVTDSLDYYQQISDSLSFVFGRNHPALQRMLTALKVTSVNDVTKSLAGGTDALLEYYCSDSSIFLMAFSSKGAGFFKIGHQQQIFNTIDSLLYSLKDGDQRQFSITAFALYRSLLSPASALLSEVKKIRIVSDPRLSSLPFDCLLASTARSGSGFRDYDYLLRHYTISYSPNAGMAILPTEGAKAQSCRMLGIAPAFTEVVKSDYQKHCKKTDSLWMALPEQRWTLRFAGEMEKEIDGKWLTETGATKTRFVAAAGDYQILHLATHTIVDEENPLQSKIALACDAGDSVPYLFAGELFELPLNAELAVLGSCGTGKGNLSRGEGVLSLEYAFRFAGCKCLVYSLWDVDEKQTTLLMKEFYQQLLAGLPADEALRNAKMKMLQNANEYTANPYYWAGFVLSGNSAKLDLARPAFSGVLPLALGVLAAFLLLMLGMIKILRPKKLV